MKTLTKHIILLSIIASFAAPSFAQVDSMRNYRGNRLNRAKNVMSGNLVRTTYYNYGLVGNIGEISGEWPIGTGNEYVGDVSPLVGVEFVHPSGELIRSVCTSDGPRASPDGPPGGGTFWGFEPLKGFAAPPVAGQDPKVAMSNQPDTWPRYWPDKNITDSLSRDPAWVRDLTDPGWPNAWNGYFGKNVSNADQECYFQMDDHADAEWFQRTDDSGRVYYYYPHAQDTARRGLGLRVAVRGLQWSHFLAQDVIFWLYEITNISTHTYDKVTFGMVVGTLSGGRGDSNDDLALFDLENDITYSWDSDDQGSSGWVPVSETRNVGYVGYAYLESPGNPLDGIDNDGDSEDLGSPILTGPVIGQMLAPRVFAAGEALILIDYTTYERTIAHMPTDGPLVYFIRDERHLLFAGQQVMEIPGNGLDDNFNGLIDEQSIHRDLAYMDYFTGQGLSDPLIDEARDDGIDNDGDWDPLTDDVGADGVPLTGDLGEGDGEPTNGEPHFDKTDVDESDQIGLTSFDYFFNPGTLRMSDDGSLWNRMTPGRFSVIPDSAGDGDFVYGAGYFPLRPGQTERFSMALLYGEDLVDITDNKVTVQQIYDENYNFARPPEKPTIWVAPGDGKVTLYWDNIAESSFDPISGYDFEGYKIYRSTDPGFNEIFTITDGHGRKVFHKPIAQFDLDNGNAGFFPVIRNSVIYYLGEDTGLQHSWTDNTVENGQTYYYAVVAYDHGDIEKGILPAENSKTIVVDETGTVTPDINTAVVVPTAPAAGYEDPVFSPVTHVSGFSSGTIGFEVVDPRLVLDNQTYRFTFATEDDSLTTYTLVRSGLEGVDTVLADLPLVPDDRLLTLAPAFADYYDSLFNVAPGSYDPIDYFRIAASGVFDGQRALFTVPREVKLIRQVSGWEDGENDLYNFSFRLANYSSQFLVGEPIPNDFQVEWHSDVVDTSAYFNWFNLLVLPATPVNFRVKSLNTNEYIPFAFDEVAAATNGILDPGEVICFLSDTVMTWIAEFSSRPSTGDTIRPGDGDVLILKLYQPYSDNDIYEHHTRAARVNPDAVRLDRIKVYPNPYVTANVQEPSNPFNEGRGERRITFNHLPDRCTIRIYTVKGELVNIVEHDAGIDDGSENWNLRTRDGLDISYGVYLYHVDSPYGEKTGRFAVIK